MSGPISSDRLKSFIERIERLIEERKSIQDDIKDIYSEAKAVGYDGKTMRKVIALRALDDAERAEQQALLETYLHSLGMVDRIEERLSAGASVRETAKATGASKSAVHRVSQKVREDANRDSTRNGATSDTVPGDDARTPEPSRSAEVVANPIKEVDASGDDAGHRSEQSRPAEQSVNAGPSPGVVSPHRITAKDDTPAPISDSLDIPPFLRREKAA